MAKKRMLVRDQKKLLDQILVVHEEHKKIAAAQERLDARAERASKREVKIAHKICDGTPPEIGKAREPFTYRGKLINLSYSGASVREFKKL